jgi:two-component system, OmpR family, sensor histidine kinase KdpD
MAHAANLRSRTKRTTRLALGAGWGSAVALLLSYFAFRLHFKLATADLIELLVVLLVALRFGFWEATSSSLVAVACLDYFFAPPIFSFHVADPQDWVALASFELTALIVSRLSIQLQNHMREAVLHRRNAEKLYELSRSILPLNPQESPGPQVAHLIGVNTGADTVAIFDSVVARLYTAGTRSEEAEELARNTYLANTNHNDHESHKWERVLRTGPNSIGAIALSGIDLNPLMADAIASLAATALERTHAFEKASRAEAARQSEQLRTAVLDALAHAFKTPLTVILTSTSGLIEMNDLNPTQTELVQLIDQHAIQLNALMTHLLRMAKLESSEIRLRREDLPVPQLVDETLAKCAEQLGGHSVQVCIPDQELAVFGDRELLATTITEFVSNAAKYSSAASTIVVSAQERDDRVVIAVHNEGSVIGPKERELIFERFYRSPATKHRASGSGIGLSVAKKTAEAHQGRVWVTSNRDAGTTFFLSLPAARRVHEAVSK